MEKSKQTLKDPVEKSTAQQEAEQAKTDEQLLSFSLTEFKGISPETARIPNPFEGYPFEYFDQAILDRNGKPKTVRYNKAFIVVLKPGEPVYQDPSGFKYTPGNKPAANVKQVKLVTPHSRCVRDFAEKKNFDVVFDRTFIGKEGKMERCSIVPSHNVRAQICYKLNPKTSKVEVDGRYFLMDPRQAAKLRGIYLRIANMNKPNETLAALVTGEVEAVPAGHDDITHVD